MANTIVRWNPFREMASMQSAMDRMFEDAWKGNFPNFAGWTGSDTPALDIHGAIDDQRNTVGRIHRNRFDFELR